MFSSQSLVILSLIGGILGRMQVTHVRGDSRRNEAIVWCFVTAKPPMRLTWKSGNHQILSVNVSEILPPMDSDWNLVQGGKLYPQKDFLRKPGKFYGMLKRRKGDYAFALVIPTKASGVQRRGNFVCEVGNSPPVSNKTLALKFPPNLIPEKLLQANNSEIFVLEGMPQEFTCPFDAHPMPDISWRIPKNSRRDLQFENEKQKLKISKVTRDHFGDYECLAKNAYGKSKLRFSLKPGETPKLMDSSKYDRILESFVEYLVAPLNKKITLNCSVSGKPTPQISWYRRDTKRLRFTSSSIRVRSPKARNSTFFSCFASNQFGQVEKMFYVFREGKIPVFRTADVKSNITARSGDDILLDCSTYGIPIPEITWFKNGDALRSQEGILKIADVDASDSGVYKCKGGNRHGFFSRTFFVKIK
ncbi:hypothetical protein DMENIID0001_080870 [Sergentomyia squamirostris]